MFSGGGPLGALQVGALKAMADHGIRPDLAVGTSVGALNAAWTSHDPSPVGLQRLESNWLTMREGDLFPGGRFKASWARMLVRGNRVFENSGLKRAIVETLGDARFEDMQVPLAVTATDLDTGEERVFNSGPVLLPLLASAAMPGIFPPVVIDGHTYTDGGVANNVPIAPAVTMGATTLYVMDATSHSLQKRPLNRPMDYLLHAFSLARGQRLTLERAFYQDKVRIIMLPSAKLDFFVPFASMEYTPRLIETAYNQTSAFLGGDAQQATEQIGDVEVEVIAPAK